MDTSLTQILDEDWDEHWHMIAAQPDARTWIRDDHLARVTEVYRGEYAIFYKVERNRPWNTVTDPAAPVVVRQTYDTLRQAVERIDRFHPFQPPV